MEDEKKLLEEINMINKLNSKDILYQFNIYDLIKIKKIFIISDLNIIKKEIEKDRKINVIINSKNKVKLKYDLNNNKYFLLLQYYFIFKYNKILQSNKLFYISNLISFHTIFLFLDFFLEINEENKKNMNLYIINIIEVIAFLKNIIKITEGEQIDNKDIINSDIHNLLERIFAKNNMESITNIVVCQNLAKYPKLLSLLKLCYNYYNNDILNEKNRHFIINNLKKIYSNNLNYEHLNYLYKISNEYLKSDFINKIPNPEKNYYSFYNGIIDFFEQIMTVRNPYLLDRYFIFNSSEIKKEILITSPIDLKERKNDSSLNLSFIFSFRVIQSKDKNKNNLTNIKNVLLSINDYRNRKYIFRFIIKENKLYLDTFTGNIILIENIQNNKDYLCFAYLDENDKLFHFHPKKDDKIITQKNIFKEISQIYLEIGNYIYKNDDDQNSKFNGLIGPVLVFNSKVDNPLDIYRNLIKIKKYHLLGDIIINSNNNNENIFFSYDEYYGISNNKNELINIINELKNVLKNLIYYINPEIIKNNINFYKGNKFRDYQIYNNPFDPQNHQNKDKYFEIKNGENMNDFILIQNSFEEFFINNNMFDYFILNIELIYNELLQLNNKNISEKKYNIL